MRRIVTLLSVSLVAACGPADDPTDVDTDLPAADCSTPLPMSLDWTDAVAGHETRSVTYDVPWTSASRTLGLELWYPTDDTEGEPAAYLGAFTDTQAFTRASFADPSAGCPLPVAVYSHGSQSWGGSASTLMRHLAAQGWVVAAPDHTGNVFLADEGPHEADFGLLRTEDILRTIDALEGLPSDHPLAARLDTSKVLVVGHSFGGRTAWMLAGPDFDEAEIADDCGDACTPAVMDTFEQREADPRIAAVMPLDGSAGKGLVAAEGWNDVTVPIFAQSQDTTSHTEMFTRASGAPVTWVTIEGSCHESFTGNPIVCATLDKEEGLQIAGTYLSAFAAHHILGHDDDTVMDVLDGTTEVSPRVTLQTVP